MSDPTLSWSMHIPDKINPVESQCRFFCSVDLLKKKLISVAGIKVKFHVLELVSAAFVVVRFFNRWSSFNISRYFT